jgi:hypothetical protein
MGKHFVVALMVLAACGKSDKGSGGGGGGGGSGSGSGSAGAVPALDVPALGVDAVKRFNFPYEKAEQHHKKALAAYKTKDWPAVRTAAEAAFAADSNHLDAHRLWAVAAVQLGTPDAAMVHLTQILAADWYRFHAELAADADLAAFWKSPQGTAVKRVDDALGTSAGALAVKGPWILARRSGFKWPSKPGTQWATTRGELYALDLDTKRYVRLTHTGHAVAAVVVAPSGNEVAVIGYDKVEMPDPAKAAASPPVLTRAWVEAYDPATWAPTTKRATIGKGRAAAIAYGAGDQLLVASIAGKGRWELGDATWSSVDRATGKTTKVASPPPADAPRAVVTLDEAWVERPLPAVVSATWSASTPAMPALTSQLVLGGAGGKTVDVPESGKTERSSIAVSPGGARVAFATWTDPCAPDAKRSLYVVDVATGQLRHLLTEASQFRSRWLDDDRVVYEDAAGGLRIWSATERKEVQRIPDKYGLALDALSARLAPLCKSAPPEVEPDPGEETMPPEEDSGSGSGGPVTTPAP